MASKYSWKDLAGTAKKWLDSKVTETTTADRRTRETAEGQQVHLEREMKDQFGGAVLTTAFPSLGRLMDRQDENRRRSEQESLDGARARRAASVLAGSSIELSGDVSGRVIDVAVELTPDDEQRTLLVLMEPVDAAPVSGGELSAAGFAITDFDGPGTYPLVEYIESLDPGAHHVVLDGGDSETSWFYWTEQAGAAAATVTDELIEVSFVCENAAGQRTHVTMRVPLA
ncbi:MAG: hypothetical protein AB7L17_07510 [Ilumatobacteraceae bacterium]